MDGPPKSAAAAKAGPRHNYNNKPLNFVTTLIGQCLCNTNATNYTVPSNTVPNFLEIQGIRFIGLGAVMDELTPKERVYDTLEVSRTKTGHLVSIGYLEDGKNGAEKSVHSLPLQVIELERSALSKDVAQMVDFVKKKQFQKLADELKQQFNFQKKNSTSGNNFYLTGITAHNLGVTSVLLGQDETAIKLFREAIQLKEAAFTESHRQVILSLEELGIQLFAQSDFSGAMKCFKKAYRLRDTIKDAKNPLLAMTLNNIACCEFQTGQKERALKTLEQARDIQHSAVGSSVDLDLLHVAIVYGNCGYLNLALKNYDDARAILEEALLIQQSVLDNDHRAVRDSLSNLEFCNAFHS